MLIDPYLPVDSRSLPGSERGTAQTFCKQESTQPRDGSKFPNRDTVSARQAPRTASQN